LRTAEIEFEGTIISLKRMLVGQAQVVDKRNLTRRSLSKDQIVTPALQPRHRNGKGAHRVLEGTEIHYADRIAVQGDADLMTGPCLRIQHPLQSKFERCRTRGWVGI